METKDYKKYRWFYTKSGKLVVGGKSASQNDELIKSLKSKGEDYIAMHTSTPGSPFAVILEETSKVKSSDLKETAIFTVSFSRQWKDKKSKAQVHIFKLSQLGKTSSMKAGTWGVKGKIEKVSANLSLVLTKQKSVLRAVPESSVKSKKQILLRIVPGKIDKSSLLPKLAMELGEKFSQEEILSALPAGGIKIKKDE
tara:strand:- start:5460 stop:6050 length:591 start_codon:yes stop_codon:yes gene_type:complete